MTQPTYMIRNDTLVKPYRNLDFGNYIRLPRPREATAHGYDIGLRTGATEKCVGGCQKLQLHLQLQAGPGVHEELRHTVGICAEYGCPYLPAQAPRLSDLTAAYSVDGGQTTTPDGLLRRVVTGFGFGNLYVNEAAGCISWRDTASDPPSVPAEPAVLLQPRRRAITRRQRDNS